MHAVSLNACELNSVGNIVEDPVVLLVKPVFVLIPTRPRREPKITHIAVVDSR